MRSREDRSKFLDRILNDSEEARYWAENCSWEPGTGYCRIQRTLDCNSQCNVPSFAYGRSRPDPAQPATTPTDAAIGESSTVPVA